MPLNFVEEVPWPRAARAERIVNHCPSCGAQSLFVGSGGWLTCSVIGCRNPSPEHAFQQAREDIIRASQLQHELDEARAEALAMRQERDREVAARVAVERGLAVADARVLFGIREAGR